LDRIPELLGEIEQLRGGARDRAGGNASRYRQRSLDLIHVNGVTEGPKGRR
jgi:hypothetical protein